ncbi:MAG: hypothetical protein ACI9BH_002116, partial [Paracoccaceae bacterium]
KNPVMGSDEQGDNAPPSTLMGLSGSIIADLR